MAKAKQAQEKALNAFIPLEDMPMTLGKFSNNLVKLSNEDEDDEDAEAEEVGVWTFPGTGILLPDTMLNALYQDEYTHRCWFEKKKGVFAPMPWVTRLPPPIPFGLKFENVSLAIAYAESPNKNTPRDSFDGCKIGRIRMYPQSNTGHTEMRCHVQIKPGMGPANKRLQEYQNRRVALSVMSADIAATKDERQAQLALGAPEPNGQPTEGDQFAAAAKAQVEAFRNGRRRDGERESEENGDEATH